MSGRGARDLAALQTALAAEHAASYGYGIVGAHLSGKRYTAAAADWVAHQRARDRLTAMLTKRGAQPRPAAAAYRLPIAVSTATGALSLAIILERRVAAAYLDLVAVPDPALRTFAAQNMRDSTVRAARWGGRTKAFPALPPSSLRPPRRSAR